MAVKKQTSVQVRYAKAVILVSERGLHHHITESHGKPIRYVALTANWGLAT
jgi:hypothetical protein